MEEKVLQGVIDNGERLAEYLLKHGKTKSWDNVKDILQKSIQYVKMKQQESHQVQNDLKTVMCTINKVSFGTPRGKFDIKFGVNHFALIDPKGTSFMIDRENVTQILKLPKQDPVKKNVVAQYYFVICLEKPVRIRNANVSNFLAQFNTRESATLKIPVQSQVNEFITGTQIEIMDKALQKFIPKISITRTLPEIRSADGFISTNNQPYIKCYLKTSNGQLYLLPEGLLFMSPLVFIPRKQVAAIQSGRGGSASSRTFDLTVELTDGSIKEFSMVEREEMGCITDFVQHFSKLKEKDEVDSKDDKATTAAPEQENDDDEEEDEDYKSSDADSDSGSSEALSGEAESESDGGDDEEDEDEENDDDEEEDETSPVKKSAPFHVDGSDTESDKDGNEKATLQKRKPECLNGLEAHGFFVKRSKK